MDFKDFDANPQILLIIIEYEPHVNSTDLIENRLEQVIQNKNIVLEPGDKFFNMRVALSDYREAPNHRFAYKIDGYQKEWQEDRSNLIRISGLPYGDYSLKIKGRLANGQFAQPGLSIPTAVLKSFYLQNWFIAIASLLFFLSIFSFNRLRTKQLKARQKELESTVNEATLTIRQKNEELEQDKLKIEQDKQKIEQQATALRALDKTKSRFFANVSHEFRTPLTLILSPIQSILKSNELNNRNEIWLRMAQQSGERLLRLTNEILDLNKLEAGKLSLQLSRILLFNFLKRIIASFQSHAENASIELLFQYELEKALLVKIDTKKTETIIINLLSNALKFTPSGGQIIVVAKNHQKYLQIAVQDTGRGIHRDDLPHIFNRFFQTKQVNRLAEGGTGIGLALSQEFAKLMDGKLDVASKLKEGTTFTLSLPLIEVIGRLSDEEVKLLAKNQVIQNGQASKVESKEGDTFKVSPSLVVAKDHNKVSPSSQTTQSTILIVEDNIDLRQYLQTLLSAKFQVHTAENGQIALDYLASNTLPNLILSDIMMPIMDGYQLLERLKATEQYQFIPVIMLTALAQADHKLKALRIGVDDYMLKPFSEEELMARIANLLQHAHLRQQFIQENPVRVAESDAPSTETEAAPIELSQTDIAWLEELENITLKNLGNFNLSVEHLATEMAQSRWQLNRHLKTLTGLSPRQYLLETRLNQARTLLEQRGYKSVKAITYTVGIKGLDHFSRQFKARFGKSPSEYL